MMYYLNLFFVNFSAVKIIKKKVFNKTLLITGG